MDEIEIRTHSALHVVKGAARRALGARVTASTFVKGSHGVLTVCLDAKPDDASMGRVDALARQKIGEGAAIRVEELQRDEAERKYGNDMYDLFPVPSSIKTLKVVVIADWNVNACDKQHTPTTREIGGVTLGSWRYRNSKKMLEMPFDVVQEEAA